MFFTEEFQRNLPEEPILAIKKVCDGFLSSYKNLAEVDMDEFDEYLDAFAMLQILVEKANLKTVKPVLGKNITENIKAIVAFYKNTLESIEKDASLLKLRQSKEKYALLYGTAFSYEFSAGDLKILPNLISNLHGLVSNNRQLGDGYKKRIVERLETLQSKLHKKWSELDNFWGLVGDIGVIKGKLGDDAKPITDKIREITDMVWRTQVIAEELPTDTISPLHS